MSAAHIRRADGYARAFGRARRRRPVAWSLCYLKLRPYLAVSEISRKLCGPLPKGSVHVRWMPRLGDGYRRLTFGEWCQFYGIAPFSGSR